jgi:hypothetical protein
MKDIKDKPDFEAIAREYAETLVDPEHVEWYTAIHLHNVGHGKNLERLPPTSFKANRRTGETTEPRF